MSDSIFDLLKENRECLQDIILRGPVHCPPPPLYDTEVDPIYIEDFRLLLRAFSVSAFSESDDLVYDMIKDVDYFIKRLKVDLLNRAQLRSRLENASQK